jgi:hypothetical protein
MPRTSIFIIFFLKYFFIFSSCVNRDQSFDVNQSDKIAKINKCVIEERETYDLNSLKVKNIQNLDIYNGFKSIRFGSNINNYTSCFNCKDNGNFRECFYNDSINFLESTWKIELLSEYDSIISIKLTSPNNSKYEARRIYLTLSSIFGNPNEKPLTIEDSEKVFKTYYKIHDNHQIFSPYYSESNDDIIYLPDYIVEGKSKPSSLLTLIKSNKQSNTSHYNTNHKLYEDNYYKFLPKRPKEYIEIEYYPSINLGAHWSSSSQMKLNLIRKKNIKFWDGKNYEDYNQLNGMKDYKFEEKWTFELILYKNISSLIAIKNFYSEKEFQEIRKNKLEDEKKELENLTKF